MKAYLILLLAGITITVGSCSKSSDNTNQSLEDILLQGDWYVHYFLDGSDDKTSEIIDYTFSFNSGNALVAAKTGSAPANGTWDAFTDSGKEKLEIIWSSLGTIPAILAEIEEDWILVNKSSSLIELEDDNGVTKKVIHFRKR